MSLGFEQAGFDVTVAVEVDPVHAAMHHFNFPVTTTLAHSVIGLDVRSVLQAELEGNGNGTVDVVFGGAPCQGFSLMGQPFVRWHAFTAIPTGSGFTSPNGMEPDRLGIPFRRLLHAPLLHR